MAFGLPDIPAVPSVGSVLGDALSFLGGLANPFGTPSEAEWNLTRGIFTVGGTTVVFFYETSKGEDSSKRTAIDQITDQGGRRLAIYEYPYRDGQAVKDLGRRGETFVFNIKFWGSNYQEKLAEFVNTIVNSSVSGTLTHPVRGAQKSITARFKDYEFMHRYDEWNAVTIRATFIEDNTDVLVGINTPQASPNSALRSALQALTSAQAALQQGIFAAGGLALLPSAILHSMINRVTSITGQVSALLGALAATYSTDAQLIQTLFQASSVGGIGGLNSGTASTANVSGTLPPVYQAGFDPATQAAINAQSDAFVNASQVSPQHAVFAANSARAAITTAIAEIEANLGNGGYDLVVMYRGLAISVQQAVESSLSAAQGLITVYEVPYPMSLRTLAWLNGLTPDDGNVIEQLNPYLPSVNWIEKGTRVTVPVAS